MSLLDLARHREGRGSTGEPTLVELLSPAVDTADLAWLAALGSMNRQQALAILKRARAGERGRHGRLLDAVQECFFLAVWQTPNRRDQHAADDVRFHGRRAWCCATILAEAARPDSPFANGLHHGLLGALVESCRVVGSQAIRLIPAAMMEERPRSHFDDCPYAMLVIVWAACMSWSLDVETSAVLCRVLDAQRDVFEGNHEYEPDPVTPHQRYLLGWDGNCMRPHVWISVGEDLCGVAPRLDDLRLRERIAQVGRWLTVDDAFLNDRNADRRRRAAWMAAGSGAP